MLLITVSSAVDVKNQQSCSYLALLYEYWCIRLGSVQFTQIPSISFYINLYDTCILYKIKMKNLCLVFLFISHSICVKVFDLNYLVILDVFKMTLPVIPMY